MAEHHVLGKGIVEHAEASADNGLPFSRDIPCKAYARGEVFLVGVVELAQAGLTHLGKCEVTAGGIEIGDIAEKVALFLRPRRNSPIGSHNSKSMCAVRWKLSWA